MDEDWKNRSQRGNPAGAPEENNTQFSPVNTDDNTLPPAAPAPVQPIPPRPSGPQPQSINPEPLNTSEHDKALKAFSQQNVYDKYDPNMPPPKRRRTPLLAILLILVLVGAGAGAYFFIFNKGEKQDKTAQNTPVPNQPEQATGEDIAQKTIEIPGDWKTIDTEFGFTVKAPPDWTKDKSLPLSSDFEGLVSKNMNIGLESPPNSGQVLPYRTYVSVGTESLKGSKSETEFYKKVTDKDFVAGIIALFGANKSDVKVNDLKVNINGRIWRQVDVEAPDIFSRTLYFWDGDHAITLAISPSSKKSLDSQAESYLFPVAASLELK